MPLERDDPRNSETPAGSEPNPEESATSTSGSQRIGPYRILEPLAEGGMGMVYLARQTEPVKRQVALKLIKPGMDTKQVIARFEAERQALAVMDHPNIAKVFDGGTTADGRPYFAMEYVPGVSITEYCDMHKLPVRARLELFQGVCQAVQHAHQKGVIHRDLKPTNILVAEQDGQPLPKVIDFGIAKAMGPSLTEKTLHTQLGQLIGTPAYMSPEQAEMTGLDVDTRTDIYSLGVILYELLAGELPFEHKDLQGFGAIVTLRDTEAARPSLRFDTLGDRKQYIADCRSTDPGTLTRRLKGDLDWIVMKAIEKDRTRRYDTANALLFEIRRYLDDEPVLARAPSTAYRMGKFVRRHKAGVAAGSVVAFALVAGFTLATVGMLRARSAERTAQQEAETARQVSDFLVGLFQLSDPTQARTNDVTAREILDRGAQRIETDLTDQPLVQARMMATMGSAYRGLGRYESATPLLEGALEKLESLSGEEDLEVARTKLALANLMIWKADYPHAESLSREALATYRQIYGDQHPALAVPILNLVFGFLRAQANYDEAESLLLEALNIKRAAGEADEGQAATLDQLCWVYINKGDLDAAELMCRDALELRRRLLGPDHFDIATSLHRMAVVYRQQGRYNQALATYEEALSMNRRLFGDEHPEMAYNLDDMGIIYRTLGEPEKGLPLAREAVRIRRKLLRDDNPERSLALYNLAALLRDLGRSDEAADIFLEALAVDERALAADHERGATYVLAFSRLAARRAATLRALGRDAEAAVQERRARDVLAAAVEQGLLESESRALVLNGICWWGTLAGQAVPVLPVCEAAVDASDEANRPRIRDSRALARTLTGDYAGAIKDFQYYMARPANVAGVGPRRSWVEALRNGENPFTQQELDRLILP
ncbi:MAG: serine/threonine-protein kinase [Gemmatimonadales bacterium]|jgi:serine/threonine protein kinase/tetratricopeptide (TPR) repeat protein